MGKMKEVEVMTAGKEGFEPSEQAMDLGSIPVKSLEEFISSELVCDNSEDIYDIKTNDIISQFEFKAL